MPSIKQKQWLAKQLIENNIKVNNVRIILLKQCYLINAEWMI